MESRLPLFKQLQNFCAGLENEVSMVKTRIKNPPGSEPENYYNGLKDLESEIKDVMKLGEEVKEKAGKIHQFGYFVQSIQELLKEQVEDVTAMETYLQKFGYKVPDDAEFINEDEATPTQEELDEEEKKSREEILTSQIMTPELSTVGKTILEGKDLPTSWHSREQKNQPKAFCPSTDIEPVSVSDQGNAPTTPAMKKKKQAWYSTLTPNVSSMKKVEDWLQHVEHESSLAATPMEAIGQDPYHLRESHLYFHSPSLRKRETAVHGQTIPEEQCTPDEPVLSAFRTGSTSIDPSNEFAAANRFRGDVQSHTPDEPPLSQLGRSFIDSRCLRESEAEQQDTPEEPVLSHRGKRPDSPSLQNSIDNLPEEPQLSDITHQFLNAKTLRFSNYSDHKPSEPSPKYEPVSPSVTHLLSEPQTPELSDVTLKLLCKRK